MCANVVDFKSLIVISLLCLTACAQQQPQKQTMRLCDASGCADRPHDYASFDPEKNAQEDDPGGKIAALEGLAKNDPRAAYDLALRLFRGDGIKQDSYKALTWMRDAAERGDFDAQKALGRVYLTGLGEMGADYGEAQKWLNITASRGDKEALGLLQEANAARKSELDEYRWYSRQRSFFYNYWHSGYRYHWYWGNGGWGLY
jgi:uncharacterized protein